MRALRILRSSIVAHLLGLVLAWSAGAEIIDFDELTGKPGPFTGACEPEFQVDVEYQSLGVLFESNDPAVCVLDANNATSAPNAVTGITDGDIDGNAPLIASFYDSGSPAAVAVVKLRLTTGSQAKVEALDINGDLLGGSGKIGAGLHKLSFPRRIHQVRVSDGLFGLDDFSFTPLGPAMAVPFLGGAGRVALLALFAVSGARMLWSRQV